MKLKYTKFKNHGELERPWQPAFEKEKHEPKGN